MKLNTKLLKDLYMIDHPSGSEQQMITFILNYCKNIPNITFELDHYNNLFVTKNTNNPETYACLLAHTDQIETNKGAYRVYESNGVLYGLHKIDGSRCGLGCDDANGICVALQMLEELPDLKVIFTTEEEVGAKGAVEACFNTDFLYNIRYFLQADRRGSSDLITHTNGIDVVTDEFILDLSPIMNKYGYSENTGTFTDVGELVENVRVCGVNISCGYYLEHTVNEHCKISELENCLNFIYEILTTLTSDKQYHIEVLNKYSSHYNYYWDYEPQPDKAEEEYPSESNDYYSDFSDNLPCDKCRDMDCMNCKFLNDY